MINPKIFVDILKKKDISFITGVLTHLKVFVPASVMNILMILNTSTNEGSAIALAIDITSAQIKYQWFTCKILVLAML